MIFRDIEFQWKTFWSLILQCMHVVKDWKYAKMKKKDFSIYLKVGRSKKAHFLAYEFYKQRENSIYPNEIPQMTYSMCKWKAVTDLLRINNIVHIVMMTMNIIMWLILTIEGVPYYCTRKKRNHLDTNQK